MASLKVLIDEDLAEKAEASGFYFRQKLEAIGSPFIGAVRGKGLLNAITIKLP